MVDERLRRAAFRWGLIAVIAQICFVSKWVISALRDLKALLAKYGAATLADRMSQLKPMGFKFPWVGVYLALFAIVAVAIAAGLFYLGVREAFEGRPPAGE